MKVLVQITSASTGGIGRLTRDICDTLPVSEYKAFIAYGRGDLVRKKYDYKFDHKLDIYVHAILSRIADGTGLGSYVGTRRLVKWLRHIKPDIIHLHNLHGYYINIPVLFKYLAKTNIPVVWTFHDCWNFTGHCTHFSLIQCHKWKDMCYHCPQLGKYPISYFDYSTRNYFLKKKYYCSLRNLTIVTPSKWLQGLVEASFLRKYPSIVINNGIDLKLFRVKSNYSRIKVGNRKIILGLASTWSDRKGLGDFLKLSQSLSDEYVIVLVGLTKSLIKKLPGNVVGITHTENAEQLVDLYNNAFVFINPTYEDNFPTTNIEAMACGTSVITYNTGGSPESLTLETGYVLEQGDVKGILQVIRCHVKNELTIKACRERAMQFDKFTVFSKYKELYGRIINT